MISEKNKNVILLIAKATGASLKSLNNLSPELLKQAEGLSKIIDKIRTNKI